MSNRWKGGFIQAYFDPLTVGPAASFLYAWGSGNNGYLGTGNTVYRSSPVQVSGANWAQISSYGQFSVGLKTDGTIYSWGLAGFGRTGTNDIINKSSPVQIGALNTWYQISAGTGHAVAIKTDGTLWAWGSNSFSGSVGDGTGINRSSPVQIGSLTTWSQVSAGNYSTIALKTDGTIWMWGYNNAGQLGRNNIANTSSPVQVGAGTDWAYVASGGSTLAIKTNGTLWSWGDNGFGRLGQNISSTTDRSSPVQVGSLSNWSQATLGLHAVAVKTDGTLWAWGANSGGQLGKDTTDPRSSPVQIGSLTDWSEASAANGSHSAALKTDGTIWAWGNGNQGELGQNNTANTSSPVQVGALNTWTSVTSSDGYMFGILSE
jgi:alpha-tubulin suppressor-like RCC1 family protein